ncbi:TPA: restriction endonuclease subunit S [Bacillus cereus]|nr:restriction endonuclease subunit S [Bacillus cereus]
MTIQGLKFHKVKWKYLAKENLMYGANESAELDDPSLPRYIRITDLDIEGNLKEETFKSLEWEKAKPYLLQKGDVLLARSGATVGKAYIHEANISACFAGYLIKLKVDHNKVYPKFLYYYTQTKEYADWISENTIQATIQNVSAEKYANLEMPLPSLVEQQVIVSFLNEETKNISEIVKQKERLIAILEEKRQAMITEAVTKGLNPNVKMKDSGVEWIGEMPEHWEVKPLYTVYKENKTKNKNNLINNVLSLSYGKIKRRNIESNYGLLPESFETYQVVENGYLVLRLTDLQNDKRSLRVGLVNETGIITSAYVGLKNSPLVNSRYAYYLLHSYDLAKVYYGLGSGVRQSMGYAELKKLPILIPDLNEQEELVRYLDKMNTQTEDIIKDLKKQIQNLKEYRQSLIYEAVTGKINVRDFEVKA